MQYILHRTPGAFAVREEKTFSFQWDPVAGGGSHSDTYEAVVGLGAGDESREDYLCRLAPDHCASLKRLAGRLTPASPAYSVSYPLVRTDGREVQVDEHAHGLFDSDGHITRVLGIVVASGEPVVRSTPELTVSIGAETEDKTTEATPASIYRTIAGNFPDGFVVLIDRDLRIQMAQGETLGTLGFDLDALPGKYIHAFDAHTRGTVASRCRRALEGERLKVESVYRGRHFLAHYVPIHNDAGEVAWMVLIALDVTERKQAEEAARLSEHQFREAFAQAPVGMAILELDGRYIHVNRAYCRIFGYEAEDLLRIRLQDIAHEQEVRAIMRDFRRLVTGRIPVFVAERQHRRRDGRRVWIHLSATVRRDANDRPVQVVALVEDITARKEAERALVLKTEELKRSNAELEEFAYVASHDLKEPLRAVANLVYSIEEDAAHRLDSHSMQLFRMLRSRVMRMDRLIDALLAYGRMGQLAEDPGEPVALSGLLRPMVADMLLPDGFRIEVLEPLPVLSADREQLRHIFSHLIANAVQHHDREEGRVEVRARDGGECWYLEVADDGPGIPECSREAVFKMFTTLGPVEPDHGMGIGLALVKKLALNHGARVEALDNPPRGLLIRMRWPKRPWQLLPTGD